MLVVFVAYLLIVIVIALWSARKSRNADDYILGGKKISGFYLALSERATGESAWLLLGMTGFAYTYGLSAIWVALGCVIGILFIWIFMADRLRELTAETGSLTINSLFSKKFPEASRSIGFLTSAIVIFFFMFYIAAQFEGSGKVLHETFGLSPFWGMIIGSFVVIIYTVLGGFITVVATDVFQALLMIITLVVLPIIILFICFSNETIINFSHTAALYNLTNNKSGWEAAILVLSGLSWALGYTGQPQLLTRMMAIRNKKEVKTAQWVAGIWTLLAYSGAIVIGIGGYLLINSGYLSTDISKLSNDSEHLLSVLVIGLVNPIIAGILLSGAISAMMSTASSELMVCSSALSEDVYGNISTKNLNAKKRLILNKLLTLLVGLAAFILAVTMKESVYNMVSYAWSGIGSSFGPALILLLFWKKFSKAGLFASLIGGTSGAVIWKMFFADATGISERLFSYLFAFTVAVVFSLIFPVNNKSN